MLFAMFLKSKTLFCSNWNPKIMVQFCYFLRPIFRHCTINCNCFLSCVAMDGKNLMDMDWNLKKLGHCFRVLVLFLQNSPKKYYDWCYLVKFDLCFFLPYGSIFKLLCRLLALQFTCTHGDGTLLMQTYTCKSWSC